MNTDLFTNNSSSYLSSEVIGSSWNDDQTLSSYCSYYHTKGSEVDCKLCVSNDRPRMRHMQICMCSAGGRPTRPRQTITGPRGGVCETQTESASMVAGRNQVVCAPTTPRLGSISSQPNDRSASWLYKLDPDRRPLAGATRPIAILRSATVW